VVSQYFVADKGLLKAAERSEAGFNNVASGAEATRVPALHKPHGHCLDV